MSESLKALSSPDLYCLTLAADLVVHIEAEVLEALVDTQVNDWAKSCVQILDNFISKGPGLHLIFDMDTRDNDVS